MIYEEIIAELDKRKALLEEVSNYIWDNPEIAFHEVKAAEKLCGILEQEGFEIEKGIAGMDTAFKAAFGQGKPVIGILGEYDALDGMSQVQDALEKQIDSTKQYGHGCGHHALGTGSLGAVIGIKKFLQERHLEGTVIYFGCPAEEGGSGKCFMARAGVFAGVDAALSWHPCDTTGLFSGRTLAVIGVTYRFKGKSAHAAGMPHIGRSALDAVELMNVAVNFLREHVPQETRMHYSITNAGGKSPNVVQADASVFYYLRSPEPDSLLDIYNRVCKIAEGAALMTETQVEVDYHKGVSSLLPNSVLDSALFENLQALPLTGYSEEEYGYAARFKSTIEDQQQTLEELMSGAVDVNEILKHKEDDIYAFVKPRPAKDCLLFGSTDVGDVSRICPTSQIHTATWAAGTQMHTWQAVAQGKSSLMHKGILYASKILACTAADMFLHPELISSAKTELELKSSKQKYVSLMPEDAKPQIDRE
ncbi:aminobenzoyl-glutamate utilization protein B [Anaerocolumna jejuensis DSM 15929]|uniref:Aminobenzoyl-glutamate utilization protein B n=1 Tax=Anaerocolumna jejuensis DSM 15929 TaxID=1121322 RepID=A0A1M6Z720_9FIRM|nr:amidohydrolase [Anaerocolumna jejuensis]SHL26210.1 aminobenzoyl-glutamate utilization protein B [Anaerocolumna jejuensis DSM 15929]